MALTRGWIRDAVTTPLDARLMDMARVVTNADGSPRTGVPAVLNAPLLTALATMAVSIAAAPFVGSKGKADGAAFFTNDGTINVAITGAPASNSRIDVIWVKHNDNTTGDANAIPTAGVTAGVAAAAPTKPAIPTGAVELGTLRVYAGTTAANGGTNTLTETYQMTAMQGGVVPFRTAADLALWTTAADGQLAVVLADQTGSALYMWNGTAWKRSSRVLAKTSSIPAAQLSITTETNVTGGTITFDLPTACDVRISGGLQMYGGDTASAAVIRIKEGAAVLAEWTRMANSSPGSAGTSNYQNFERVIPLTAGTHTLVLAIARAVGLNVTVSPAGPGAPTQVMAEIFD